MSDLPAPHFLGPERRARLLHVCPSLEPIFRRYAERQHMPGVAYGIIVDGELVFANSFGVRDVDAQTPVDADTVFRIASMTKSFTALAIVKLRDAGQLRLDELIAAYVPELAGLRYPTADAPPLTVRHLLTMSDGWPQDDPWADRQLYISDDTLSQIFRSGASFSNPPGVVFEYSNLAYIVLGRIITNVAGAPAIEYITREILQPLGMTATTWQAATVPAARLALGYRWEDATWKAEPLLPSGGDVSAFAGLCSSVRDLARWVALFQSAWPPRDEAEAGPVRRSTLREMQQTARVRAPVITLASLGALPQLGSGGYGFGLTATHNGRLANVSHGGGVPGFGSHMRWAPDYGVGIVALANVTYANVHAACTEALDELLLASQVQPRTPQPSRALREARASVLRLLEAWDDALADALFADNFFLDTDRLRWQRRLDELRQAHGTLRPDDSFEVENWLRGRWRMTGERGWCWVFITMTPTVPPRVQYMRFDTTLPPSAAMQAAAERLALLTTRPTRGALARLFARGANHDAVWDRVRVAHIWCGACTVREMLGGDGEGRAVFRFGGVKDNAEVELTLDTHSGKLSDAIFRPVNPR